MTITLDIRPEVEAALARQAELAGRAFEAYAAELLEDAAHLPGSSVIPDGTEPRRSLEEVFAMVRGLADDLDFSRNPSTGRPLDLS